MFVLQELRYSPFEKEVGRHWPSLSTIGQMNEKGEQLEFSDFSRILYSYIGLGDEHPKFVLELLSLVYLGDDGFFCNQNNPFLKMNTSTLNGYFRGSKKISEKNAVFIKSNFDSTEFIDKIDSLSVDLKTNLANELGVEDTDIKALPEKCADVFLQIISDIAGMQQFVSAAGVLKASLCQKRGRQAAVFSDNPDKSAETLRQDL